MPANLRQTIKRELERARGNIDTAMLHIARVSTIYKADHPELSEPLEVCGATLITVQDAVKAVEGAI